MSSKTLIRGGCVLTLGRRTPNHAVADVLVEDGVIVEIGEGLRARDAEQVDAEHALVMPGFVDTHRHVWKSLFRNLGHLTTDSGGRIGGDVYGSHYRPEDVYAATLVGLLGALEAGITTVVDWADFNPETANIDAALEAHRDAGVRSIFVLASAAESRELQDARAVLRRLAAQRARSGEAPTTIAYGPADPSHQAVDWFGSELGLARELGMRSHAHVGSRPEDRGVVALLGERGLLADDVTLIHCSQLDDADLDAIASSNGAVALAPASEMAVGMGMPPIQELIDRGIRPGLGVDSEHMAPGDIFAQMRAANSIQHATHFDRKLAGKGGLPNLLTTREVIRFATSDGARVAGVGSLTGSLEVGKQADIIVLRTDRPNIWPINDPIGAVVWGMDTSNIDWVFVGGIAVMREGDLTGDVARARDLAGEARVRVGEAAGVLTQAGGSS